VPLHPLYARVSRSFIATEIAQAPAVSLPGVDGVAAGDWFKISLTVPPRGRPVGGLLVMTIGLALASAYSQKSHNLPSGKSEIIGGEQGYASLRAEWVRKGSYHR
jgi:hypothetical protein